MSLGQLHDLFIQLTIRVTQSSLGPDLVKLSQFIIWPALTWASRHHATQPCKGIRQINPRLSSWNSRNKDKSLSCSRQEHIYHLKFRKSDLVLNLQYPVACLLSVQLRLNPTFPILLQPQSKNIASHDCLHIHLFSVLFFLQNNQFLLDITGWFPSKSIIVTSGSFCSRLVPPNRVSRATKFEKSFLIFSLFLFSSETTRKKTQTFTIFIYSQNKHLGPHNNLACW